jgi:cysteine desulfurase / selenocysteine lyase
VSRNKSPDDDDSVDWAAVRAEFPALLNWTFLNTATYGQMPQRATRAAMGHFARRDQLACADFLDWFDDMDVMRRDIARLIGSSAADIAFVVNAAAALSLLLGGIDWRPGDRIITMANEFPNNIYLPGLLGQRGVRFVETEWQNFERELSNGARAVLMSTVSYSTGFRIPIEEAGRLCRDAGAILYVDGTQSLGALRFAVETVKPHMLAVHGYKWLLAPNGAAFMYVSPETREWLQPNVVGWRSHWDWRNVDNLHHGAPEFSRTAEKYEGAMLPFPALYPMAESVRMFLRIGLENIENRVMELAAQVRKLTETLGGTVSAPERFGSPIIAAHFPGADTAKLVSELKSRRILIAARHGSLRISTHLYNNEEDIEILGDALRSLL